MHDHLKALVYVLLDLGLDRVHAGTEPEVRPAGGHFIGFAGQDVVGRRRCGEMSSAGEKLEEQNLFPLLGDVRHFGVVDG